MRRPHVYERSVPRARRDSATTPAADAAAAARLVVRAMPALITAADTAGLWALVDLLDAARREAERVGFGPTHPPSLTDAPEES